VPRVLAGGCVPLLGVGPSRRYLLNLSLGAWTRTPPPFSGALARFFPDNIDLTSVSTGSARWNLPHHSNFGSVSKVEMVAPMTLTYKVLFSSISTFETPPRECRARAQETIKGGKHVSWVAGAVIVVLWLGIAVLGLVWVTKIGRKIISS
jgi:hypothetical protein